MDASTLHVRHRRPMPPHALLALILLAWPFPPALAHHSDSMYDASRSVSVQGFVTRYVWVNPHVYIYLVQQPGPGGSTIEWEIEGSPPSILHRLGWSPGTLKAGDPIAVTGHPSRNPSLHALLPVTIRSGTTVLFDRGSEEKQLSTVAAATSAPRSGISGIWLTPYVKAIDDLTDPDHMKLTPAGRSAYKHFDERKNPASRCVAYTAPAFMTTPDLKRITERGDTVLIESEFDAAERTVYLNQLSHDGVPSSLQGHSIGHWEGRSLVIDTARFSVNLVGNAYGLPSGTQKHLVERLTQSDDGHSLLYHFELSDPEYLARPIVGEITWQFQPTALYAPPGCNLDVARHYIRQ
ncbi:MAG TPA: DUF6152 family protein [Steroidobacteraceae bacterium]|nr:DUF6152 family protein [Steroidobacteraceae bacterium]